LNLIAKAEVDEFIEWSNSRANDKVTAEGFDLILIDKTIDITEEESPARRR
jgi:hypothetical protein